MNMKLSRRDKVIFLVVLVAVVIGVGIWLFLKPQYDSMKASEDRLAAKQSEQAELQATIDTLPDLKKTLKNNVDDVVEVQKQFISEIDIHDTQQISQYVMQMLEPSGIEITGMQESDLAATSLTEYIYNRRALAYPMKINGDLAKKLPEDVYNAYNNTYPAAGPAATIAGTVVTVSYRIDPENTDPLFEAIQLVADHEKNIYLQTASAEVVTDVVHGAEEEMGEGELVIEFYEVYPMDPADVED